MNLDTYAIMCIHAIAEAKQPCSFLKKTNTFNDYCDKLVIA